MTVLDDDGLHNFVAIISENITTDMCITSIMFDKAEQFMVHAVGVLPVVDVRSELGDDIVNAFAIVLSSVLVHRVRCRIDEERFARQWLKDCTWSLGLPHMLAPHGTLGFEFTVHLHGVNADSW